MCVEKTWDRRAVVTREVAPRSFEVQTREGGRVLRRNRRDLLKTKETFEPDIRDGVDDFASIDGSDSQNERENEDAESDPGDIM